MSMSDTDQVLDLVNIRNTLIRMEDTIAFSLIDRAQFYQSPSIYANGCLIPDFAGSFLDWYLIETEKTQSKIRRYEAPDENAFFPEKLEKPILPQLSYPKVLAAYSKEININDQIKQQYIETIVPLVSAEPGDQPENDGSTATCDIEVLQALSRRIHYGKYVAESKFRSETERFTELIRNKDAQGIDQAITNATVEQAVLDRMRLKAETYGKDPSLKWSQKIQGQIDPESVVKVYKDVVIPLTKVVEVDYLMRRLEDTSLSPIQ